MVNNELPRNGFDAYLKEHGLIVTVCDGAITICDGDCENCGDEDEDGENVKR